VAAGSYHHYHGQGAAPNVPANALFIPKPYVGRNVVAAMRTFENM